jgi:photosystem II stability/assembly factor-like uncharacterized protein
MRFLLLALAVSALPAHAQFTQQTSNTNASLRGIAIGDAHGQIAWASGTGGTVVRTIDGGSHWTACAIPAGAEKLDFRGIQAFDAQNAVVMSSGKGDASRVYKTADGCRTWKLVFGNPDTPDGFFDAMIFQRRDQGWLLGDPVNGRFYLAVTQDGGETWTRVNSPSLAAAGKGGAFAASNQSLLLTEEGPIFGGGGAALYRGKWAACSLSLEYNDPETCHARAYFQQEQVPMAAANGASGIFALGSNLSMTIAVGGDYTAPADASAVAAFSDDDGESWTASATQPHGYRSSVAYDVNSRMWITVGPNGTDVSSDQGRTWKPLAPDATKGDTADADQHWNALALPWVVGSKGRIGKLREDAVQPERR